jgi:hypothetical protein
MAGCDVVSDYNAIHLNYGLYLANQDDFDAALPILERVVSQQQQQQHDVLDHDNDQRRQRLVQDAHSLYQFCRYMIQQQQKPTVSRVYDANK